jgi:hypothetical protein
MPDTNRKWTSGRLATWVGIVSGTLAIIGTLAVNIDKWIVTDDELRLSEQRIIQKIEYEAVKTRTVYIAELIERKGQLERELESDDVTPGRIVVLEKKLETLNERIRKLRGDE